MHNLKPDIELLSEKKLIGMRLTMSFADFKIGELWGKFMPRRNEVKNIVSGELISMAIYEPDHFSNFSPTNQFDRWAAVEVSSIEAIPPGMESFTLPGGLYAVFHYKGLNTDTSIFQYIFETWLPGSAYILDNRPHFEVLGAKYKNNDPSSEEDIWIPVHKK